MSRNGGCACGAARYQLNDEPLIVHACHCSDCQRLTGSAFVINAYMLKADFELTQGDIATVDFKGGSGKTHRVFRCAECGTQLWSEYAAAIPGTVFVRVGTLDEPAALPPDVHIHTRSKQPWVVLPPDAPAFTDFYSIKAVWTPQNIARAGLGRK